MSLTNSYLTSTKNLESIINSIISAKAPERFTNKFLEDLGYKSSNDRLYISMFKALGLLEDNGQPTPRYYEFIDQTQTAKILAIGIQEAYEDLFNLNKEAQNMSNEEVKNKLKTLTQGQKKDKVLSCMANTFKSLCSVADWSQDINKQGQTNENKSVDENISSSAVIRKEQNESKMNLHYNIQIHLPETTNMVVYDAIFQSLKKHIL